MGPWNNPNLPKNQGTSTNVYRFPRGNAGTTNPPNNKTLTGMTSIGFLVDGVAIYNTSDGYSYSVGNSKDATPNGTIGQGDGIWNRDAWPNEMGSFDYALNHPQPSGQYHAHANPIGVRYLLGDNVNYDPVTKIYSENTNIVLLKHSPIIGWLNDGLPLYGPYGYSNPTNAGSGARRMRSGFVLRNGGHGTDNLAQIGRGTLPLWEARELNRSATLKQSEAGPEVGSQYPLGHYIEDYAFLGDLGKTAGNDFDLDELNGRWCVTPEFPQGTYAYFTAIDDGGRPVYPYNMGRRYHGRPRGRLIASIQEPVTTHFQAAPSPPSPAAAPKKTSLIWNPDSGGYRTP